MGPSGLSLRIEMHDALRLKFRADKPTHHGDSVL